MKCYSVRDLHGKVPEQLIFALEKAQLEYHVAQHKFMRAAKLKNPQDKLRATCQLANDAWIIFRNANKAVAEFLGEKWPKSIKEKRHG